MDGEAMTRVLYRSARSCAVIAAALLAACTSASAQGHLDLQPEPYPSAPQGSLLAVIDTEGEQNAYSEIHFFGDCADVPARPARATFSDHNEHRTLTIANPCHGEWHRSGGRGSMPGLSLTPHPGYGHFAASIVFGPAGEDVGRHKYTLTVTYAGQRLTARITTSITPGSGPLERRYAIRVAVTPRNRRWPAATTSTNSADAP